MKEWRKNLFESESGESVESALNHLGFPLSRNQGIQILGICYRTWQRWEDLAFTIPEYKLQQIKMQKGAGANTRIPIAPYQVWVVGKIGEIYCKLPHGTTKRWIAEVYLKARQDEFTRDAYQKDQQRYHSLALETTNV